MATIARWLEVLALVTAASCGSVIKPPDPDRRLEVHTNGQLIDASGGYRFAVLPEPDASIVRLEVRYPVGSADDPPGKEGLAHLVEHLLFDVEIERDGAKTSISAELGRVALSWNAETAADYTTFESMASPGALDAVVGLEVDRLAVGCAGLTPDIFEREREVVLNELREREGASGTATARAIYAQIYPAGHPYLELDSVDSVAKLQLQDVCDFLATAYQRGDATFVVSGAVDAESLKHSLAPQLARLHARTKDERPALPAVVPQPGTAHVRADVDEPRLVALWPLPPETSHEFRMLELLWDVIPDRLGAFGAMYEWGHSADLEILGGPRAPALAVSITLASSSKLQDAIDAVDKSIGFAKRSLGPERASNRWQEAWQAQAADLLGQWESLTTRNGLAADILATPGGESLTVGRIEELSRASPDEVRDLADKWINPERARYVLVEPSGVPGTLGPRTYHGGAEEHPTLVDPSLADQPLHIPKTHLTLDVDHYRLDNGLTVLLVSSQRTPLVHGRLVIDSGSANAPDGQEGVADLVGASDVYPDALVFSEASLSARVDQLVESLTWELRSPGYELTDETKKFLRGRLKMKRARVRSGYVRDLMTAVYGAGHPYARPEMTEDSIDRISRDSVMDWARSQIVPSNAVLILTGRFSTGLMESYAKYYAEQVASGGASHDVHAVPTPTRSFVPGYEDKPSPTIEIDVAFPGGEGLDETYAQRLVLAQVLDERLATLRSKQALTYGFSASYSPRVDGGLWWISGHADATRAAEAGTAVASILSEMRRDPESYRSAFVLARQKVLENLLAGVADAHAIADRLTWMSRFHLSEDFFNDLAHDVATLTLKDLQAFVATELDARHQVFGAFGNTAAVNAALDAAREVP